MKIIGHGLPSLGSRYARLMGERNSSSVIGEFPLSLERGSKSFRRFPYSRTNNGRHAESDPKDLARPIPPAVHAQAVPEGTDMAGTILLILVVLLVCAVALRLMGKD